MRVAAVVLAAGGSRRLGQPKQVVAIDGVPLVRRAALAALAAGCAPVAVIVGGHAEPTLAALEGLDVVAVVNPNWRDGVGGSVRSAVESVTRRPGDPPDALVVLGCDQPALDAPVLSRLIAARGTDPENAAACSYAGVLGTPAVFGSAWFARLGASTGDRGAAELLRAPEARVVAVDWPAGAHDIDRPEDLPVR